MMTVKKRQESAWKWVCFINKSSDGGKCKRLSFAFRKGKLDFLNSLFQSSFLYLCLFFCFNSSILHAEPIEAFCLTQDIDTTKDGYLAIDEFTNKKNQTIAFTSGGKTFFIERKRRQIVLKDDQSNELVAHDLGRSFVFDSDYLIDMALGKNGWLWIHGDHYDHYAYLDTDTMPPTITVPEEVVRLSRLGKGCSFISQTLYDYCDEEGTSRFYSKALERVFVFGRHPASIKVVEIVDGKTRPVPIEIEQAYQDDLKEGIGFSPHGFVYDLPSLNGVLFDGGLGKLLFYDGKKVISLLDSSLSDPALYKKLPWFFFVKVIDKHVYLDYNLRGKVTLARIEPDLSLTPISLPTGIADDATILLDELPLNKQIYVQIQSNGKRTLFRMETDLSLTPLLLPIEATVFFSLNVEEHPFSKQIYLTISSSVPNRVFALFRIESDLSLTPILLPKKMATTDKHHFYRHEFPQLQLVFWSEDADPAETLNVEIDNALRTVIGVDKGINFGGLEYFKSATNEGVVFVTTDTETKHKRNYFIVRASSTTQCIATLDPDHPIILGAENKFLIK
jgi:hypothetical protein